MTFLYPSFLFALIALAIPVIIHLFNFRKFKTVYFSNVSFLKDLKQETTSQSKLKKILVLIARMLAITFLVLAFAQPYIASENKISVGDAAISVFIDNSFSMEAIGKNGSLLEQAKKRAHDISNNYKNTDRFQLLTNDFEGQHQRFVTKNEFNKLIDEVKISSSTKSLSEIILRQSEAISELNIQKKENSISYIISDFQQSITDIDKIKKDSTLSVFLIPLNSSQNNNVYIDTCWFESPVHRFNQIEKLHVRLKNNSDKVLENNSIKLFINNVQKTPASFNIDKNSETEVVFSFLSKENSNANFSDSNNNILQQCRIQINDFPVTFDDTFYFSFEISKSIPVLCINIDDNAAQNNAFNKLFKTDSVFIFKNAIESKLDYSDFFNYKLIILNELKKISSGLSQELKRFIDNGGSVLVVPNEQIDILSYKEFLTLFNANYYQGVDSSKTKVSLINIDHVIYKEVFDKKMFSTHNLDLPVVNKHYKFSKNTKSNNEFLLKLQNEDLFLNSYEVGKGKLYLSGVSFYSDFSNFTKHALFVPTIYEIAVNSINSYPLFYTIGSNPTIEYRGSTNGSNVYHLKNSANNFDFIPEQKIINSKIELTEHHQIKNAGNFNLISNNISITGFSFNYNRKESNLSCYTSDELNKKLSEQGFSNIYILQTQTKRVTESIQDFNQGTKLWKICIILALLFLAAEVLLLRFVKG